MDSSTWNSSSSEDFSVSIFPCGGTDDNEASPAVDFKVGMFTGGGAADDEAALTADCGGADEDEASTAVDFKDGMVTEGGGADEEEAIDFGGNERKEKPRKKSQHVKWEMEWCIYNENNCI